MALSYEEQLEKNAGAMQDELTENDRLHSELIGEYKGVIDGQIEELDKFAQEQTDIQQNQTDFAISQIEQQKQQAQKDYTKEQSGAYADWQKQSNPYGVEAERMASAGLTQSGYSETSQVRMYTAYQKRVATARASFVQAKVAYDNAITEARLANDVALAKIAADTFAQKAQLAIESVTYIGNLQMQRANAASAIKDNYYNREQDILGWQRQAKLDQQSAKDRIIELVMNYGVTGFSAEELEEAGMTEGEVQNLYALYQSQISQRQSSGSGTGGYIDEWMGESDFSEVEKLFSDNFTGDIESIVSDMLVNGLITEKTVNGVKVYNVPNPEKAKAYIASISGAEGNTSHQSDQGTAGSQTAQTEQPKYTDEYTLLVEEYERLRDTYLAAQRKYDAITKWGPSPEAKAALEAAEKAYKNYPVKVNPDYEPQKKKVEQARAAYNNAVSKYIRDPNEVAKAEKKLSEESEKLQNMKPYIITRTGTSHTAGSGFNHYDLLVNSIR